MKSKQHGVILMPVLDFKMDYRVKILKGILYVEFLNEDV